MSRQADIAARGVIAAACVTGLVLTVFFRVPLPWYELAVWQAWPLASLFTGREQRKTIAALQATVRAVTAHRDMLQEWLFGKKG